MPRFTILHLARGVLPVWALIVATATLAASAVAQGPAYDRGDRDPTFAARDLKLAPVPHSQRLLAKERSATPPESGITERACTACAREAAPPSSRPLITALPAGESYQVRILKSAASGWRLRASDGNAPPSADERLRLQVSRRFVGITLTRRF